MGSCCSSSAISPEEEERLRREEVERLRLLAQSRKDAEHLEAQRSLKIMTYNDELNKLNLLTDVEMRDGLGLLLREEREDEESKDGTSTGNADSPSSSPSRVMVAKRDIHQQILNDNIHSSRDGRALFDIYDCYYNTFDSYRTGSRMMTALPYLSYNHNNRAYVDNKFIRRKMTLTRGRRSDYWFPTTARTTVSLPTMQDGDKESNDNNKHEHNRESRESRGDSGGSVNTLESRNPLPSLSSLLYHRRLTEQELWSLYNTNIYYSFTAGDSAGNSNGTGGIPTPTPTPTSTFISNQEKEKEKGERGSALMVTSTQGHTGNAESSTGSGHSGRYIDFAGSVKRASSTTSTTTSTSASNALASAAGSSTTIHYTSSKSFEMVFPTLGRGIWTTRSISDRDKRDGTLFMHRCHTVWNRISRSHIEHVIRRDKGLQGYAQGAMGETQGAEGKLFWPSYQPLSWQETLRHSVHHYSAPSASLSVPLSVADQEREKTKEKKEEEVGIAPFSSVHNSTACESLFLRRHNRLEYMIASVVPYRYPQLREIYSNTYNYNTTTTVVKDSDIRRAGKTSYRYYHQWVDDSSIHTEVPYIAPPSVYRAGNYHLKPLDTYYKDYPHLAPHSKQDRHQQLCNLVVRIFKNRCRGKRGGAERGGRSLSRPYRRRAEAKMTASSSNNGSNSNDGNGSNGSNGNDGSNGNHGSNDGAIYKDMRVAEMLSTLAHLELFCYVREKNHEHLHAVCALQQLEVDHEEEERMLVVEEGALAAYHSRAGTRQSRRTHSTGHTDRGHNGDSSQQGSDHGDNHSGRSSRSNSMNGDISTAHPGLRGYGTHMNHRNGGNGNKSDKSNRSSKNDSSKSYQYTRRKGWKDNVDKMLMVDEDDYLEGADHGQDEGAHPGQYGGGRGSLEMDRDATPSTIMTTPYPLVSSDSDHGGYHEGADGGGSVITMGGVSTLGGGGSITDTTVTNSIEREMREAGIYNDDDDSMSVVSRESKDSYTSLSTYNSDISKISELQSSLHPSSYPPHKGAYEGQRRPTGSSTNSNQFRDKEGNHAGGAYGGQGYPGPGDVDGHGITYSEFTSLEKRHSERRLRVIKNREEYVRLEEIRNKTVYSCMLLDITAPSDVTITTCGSHSLWEPLTALVRETQYRALVASEGDAIASIYESSRSRHHTLTGPDGGSSTSNGEAESALRAGRSPSMINNVRPRYVPATQGGNSSNNNSTTDELGATSAHQGGDVPGPSRGTDGGRSDGTISRGRGGGRLYGSDGVYRAGEAKKGQYEDEYVSEGEESYSSDESTVAALPLEGADRGRDVDGATTLSISPAPRTLQPPSLSPPTSPTTSNGNSNGNGNGNGNSTSTSGNNKRIRKKGKGGKGTDGGSKGSTSILDLGKFSPPKDSYWQQSIRQDYTKGVDAAMRKEAKLLQKKERKWMREERERSAVLLLEQEREREEREGRSGSAVDGSEALSVAAGSTAEASVSNGMVHNGTVVGALAGALSATSNDHHHGDDSATVNDGNDDTTAILSLITDTVFNPDTLEGTEQGLSVATLPSMMDSDGDGDGNGDGIGGSNGNGGNGEVTYVDGNHNNHNNHNYRSNHGSHSNEHGSRHLGHIGCTTSVQTHTHRHHQREQDILHLSLSLTIKQKEEEYEKQCRRYQKKYTELVSSLLTRKTRFLPDTYIMSSLDEITRIPASTLTIEQSTVLVSCQQHFNEFLKSSGENERRMLYLSSDLCEVEMEREKSREREGQEREGSGDDGDDESIGSSHPSMVPPSLPQLTPYAMVMQSLSRLCYPQIEHTHAGHTLYKTTSSHFSHGNYHGVDGADGGDGGSTYLGGNNDDMTAYTLGQESMSVLTSIIGGTVPGQYGQGAHAGPGHEGHSLASGSLVSMVTTSMAGPMTITDAGTYLGDGSSGEGASMYAPPSTLSLGGVESVGGSTLEGQGTYQGGVNDDRHGNDDDNNDGGISIVTGSMTMGTMGGAVATPVPPRPILFAKIDFMTRVRMGESLFKMLLMVKRQVETVVLTLYDEYTATDGGAGSAGTDGSSGTGGRSSGDARGVWKGMQSIAPSPERQQTQAALFKRKLTIHARTVGGTHPGAALGTVASPGKLRGKGVPPPSSPPPRGYLSPPQSPSRRGGERGESTSTSNGTTTTSTTDGASASECTGTTSSVEKRYRKPLAVDWVVEKEKWMVQSVVESVMLAVFNHIDDKEEQWEREREGRDGGWVSGNKKLGSNAHKHHSTHPCREGGRSTVKHWSALHGFSDSAVRTPEWSHGTPEYSHGTPTSSSTDMQHNLLSLPSLQSQVLLAFTGQMSVYSMVEMEQRGRNIYKVTASGNKGGDTRSGSTSTGTSTGQGTHEGSSEDHLSYQLTLNFQTGTLVVSLYDRLTRTELKSPKAKMLASGGQLGCHGKDPKGAHRGLMYLLQDIEIAKERQREMDIYVDGHGNGNGDGTMDEVRERETVGEENVESRVFVMDRR